MMRRFVFPGLVLALCVGIVAAFPLVADAKTACSCSCADNSTPIVNISPGNNSCQNDCAATCGGTAQLRGEQIAVTIDCVPGVSTDCTRDPKFAAYKGVQCVLTPAPDGDKDGTPDCAEGSSPWCTRYNGQLPSCIVPLTPENANLECQKFGGIANGGTCGFLVRGEDPNTYYKSRPGFGGQGLIEYTQNFTTFSAWEQAVDRPIDPATQTYVVSPTDGLCYRYGVKYGGAPTYEGFDPGTNGESVVSPTPSPAYVCLEKKTNRCGSLTPEPGDSPVLPARSYSCQPTSDVVVPEGSTLEGVCFSGSTGCEASPELRCCQGGTVFTGCIVDSDCSTGRNQVCRQGKCVEDLVCDYTPGADTYGRPYSDRRCRTATDAEKATPGVCSNPIIGGFGTCPQQGQACCIPRNPDMISSCAADKALDLGIAQNYEDFGCISQSDIPDTQRLDGQLVGIGNEDAYNPDNSPVHCLTSSLPVYGAGGQLERTIPRCGGAQRCCNVVALGRIQDLGNRQPLGASCGTKDGYTCQDINTIAGENQDIGMSSEDFLQGLVNRRACQATPLANDGYIPANKECQSGGICCDASVQNVVLCAADGDCGAGLKCDMSLGRCIGAEFVDEARASLCVEAARATAGPEFVDPVVQASGYDESQFSCQFVTEGTEGLVNGCVPQGCEGMAPPSGFNGTAQCCVPGTGQSAAAVSASALDGRDSVIQAPGGIRLSACIRDGNCTLEDILFTGAGFANFLIEISGAVFLGIFVYGGFLYLTAGTSDRAGKGKKIIIQSSIAMVLIFASFVFVNFVQQSLIGAVIQNEAQASCGADEQTANFSCQFLVADPTDSSAVSEEVSRRGCVRNKCPGPDNYLCCPL